jgi:hypothetical protein
MTTALVTHDPHWWMRFLKDKTPAEAAAFILGNLVGYNSRSKYKTDDEIAICTALIALSALRETSS